MTVERPNPAIARRLRRASTNVEQLLWQRLRDRQLADCKFRRQVPIGPYIADFVCLDAMLIVELDGGQHPPDPDARQRWLEGQRYQVLRFWNNDVARNLDGVLAAIAERLP